MADQQEATTQSIFPKPIDNLPIIIHHLKTGTFTLSFLEEIK
jgi:hypothetical protein